MKRLSFRFVRRLMLLLALVFPVVYLMGGFVAALAGSHGNVILAQDEEVVTSSRIYDFNQRVHGDFSSVSDWLTSYDVDFSVSNNVGVLVPTRQFSSIRQAVPVTKGHVYYLHVDYSGANGWYVYSIVGNTYAIPKIALNSSSSLDYLFTYSLSNSTISLSFQFDGTSTFPSLSISNVQLFDFTQMYGLGNEPTIADFRLTFDDSYYAYTLSDRVVIETTGTPTYSEYLFNQILGSDNIIKQWGYYALSDEEKGFAPFASLIKIVDDNFFHLGDSNDLGLFVYGYVYYALNIVAVYELVALVVMVFTIPLKLTDRFTKEM